MVGDTSHGSAGAGNTVGGTGNGSLFVSPLINFEAIEASGFAGRVG